MIWLKINYLTVRQNFIVQMIYFYLLVDYLHKYLLVHYVILALNSHSQRALDLANLIIQLNLQKFIYLLHWVNGIKIIYN
jgi:hypothetical protein